MTSITITDVAKLAGVSIKTVSRVLNREPHVRAQTQEKVMAAVAELNYRPNASARALAGSRSYLIGLYYDNLSPGYVGDIQYGALSYCRQAGYHLLIEELQGDPAELRRRVEDLQARVRMDGVILTPPLCDSIPVMDALDALAVPYVRISPAVQLERVPYVYMDERGAAEEMTARLIALGHRDIAFIKGPDAQAAAARRYDGFQDAMRAASAAIRPEWVEQGAFTFRSGFEAAERLLGRKVRPTAIFAANDDMALGVMAVANRWRLTMPQQLSVVGFDDSPSAQVVWPQLATVRQPVADMAAAAAQILIQGRDDDLPNGRRLDFTIVLRDSAAQPSKIV